MKKLTLLKSMLLLCALIVGSGSVWAVGIYQKVTSAPSDWSGVYLIVYEGDGGDHASCALNGATLTDDAENNGVAVTISDNTIVGSSAIDAAVFVISKSGSNYKLLAGSGNYIGSTSYANKLIVSSTSMDNTIALDGTNAVITSNLSGSTTTLRYNYASNQNRFRYYKSGQQAIALYKLTKERVTITSAGYATFVSDYALNYSGISGLTAYSAAVSTNKVSFTTVTTVPATQGVLLKGEAGNYDVPVIASASAITNDFVRGNDAAVPSSADGKYNFILNKVGGVVAFYAANGQTVAKNRAYLQSTTAPGAHGLEMSFDDNTTGIADLKVNTSDVRGEYYNLAGQRIAHPTKGLYIVNGKKVIMK